MHKESAQKVMERLKIFSLLAFFSIFSVLYFPTDTLHLQGTEELPAKSLSVDLRAAFPESFKVEAIYADIQRIQTYKEKQALWEETQEKRASPEDRINSYINEIIAENYPELDQTIVQAIVYNESRYTPDAINKSSGTMGLMQISPKWHAERAANLGVTDLLDAYGNILVGCDILAEVTRETGSLAYALDVFAGGYQYANSYIGAVSPVRANISSTVSMINSGEICL